MYIPYYDEKSGELKFVADADDMMISQSVPVALQSYLVDCNYSMKLQEQNIRRKEIFNQMDLRLAEQKAKSRADVQTEREMQTMDVYLHKNGKIQISRKRFGQAVEGMVDFKLTNNVIFTDDQSSVNILYSQFFMENGTHRHFYIDTAKVSNAIIDRKLAEVGINFGFSCLTEKRVRRLFISKLISEADFYILPSKKGWSKGSDGKWWFAFPETLTIKEVKNHV